MFARSFLFILLCLPLLCLGAQEPPRKYKYHLAVCAIFNDDAAYLKEWIEYHRLLGVDHFYLYNHFSEDGYLSVLQPYIDQGIVTLTDWFYKASTRPEWQKVQQNAYTHCLAIASKETQWLAAIDTDEFIFPIKERTIPEFLKSYERYAGVLINWQMYGTSNVWEIPAGKLMIEMLTLKAEPLHEKCYQMKTIVKPQYATRALSAHIFEYKPSYYAVATDFTPDHKILIQDYMIDRVLIDKARINHYWTRNERFFMEGKIARIEKMHKDTSRALDLAGQMNTVEDRCMDKYIAPLRDAMFQGQ
jgi:hypothetical protein